MLEPEPNFEGEANAMVDESEARRLAEAFLSKQDLRGYVYKFSAVRAGLNSPKEWSVVFDVYSSQNTVVDGPAVLIVNRESGSVSVP